MQLFPQIIFHQLLASVQFNCLLPEQSAIVQCRRYKMQIEREFVSHYYIKVSKLGKVKKMLVEAIYLIRNILLKAIKCCRLKIPVHCV